MDFFNWNSSMETGIRIIDVDHQEIAMHINHAYEAALLKLRSEEEAAMSLLVESITSHLTMEEELLEAAGFPDVTSLKRSHAEFRQRLAYSYAAFLEGDNISLALITDLRKWLTTHIRHEDSKFTPILMEMLVPETERKGNIRPFSQTPSMYSDFGIGIFTGATNTGTQPEVSQITLSFPG